MPKNYRLKNMCASDEIKINGLAKTLASEFIDCDIKYEDLFAVCHNAAKIYCTVYLDGEKAFSSPRDVMESISLEEMARLLYKEAGADTVECAINETFEEH